MPEGPDPRPSPDPRRSGTAAPRLAILSYSSGEYDARSFRIARSAIDAGYDVTVYARWHRGQPVSEQLDGYRLVRVDFDWRLAVPLLGVWLRRRSDARMRRAPAGDGVPAVRARSRARGRTRHPVLAPIVGVLRRVNRWRRIVLMFPLGPLAWARSLEVAAEPADLWHGMWAGSLPALVRLSRRHGGRTIYDSRDVYMLSRDFEQLEWPIRPALARLERRWAREVDRVLTVNEAYADLIRTQLGVPRPAVILNCPERWTPPVPPPDRIREATGVGPPTRVALYQGRLTTERGIEQAMDAILEVPGAVLVLLGFGGSEDRLREMARTTRYAGRVFLMPAVPPSELLTWTASADVMVMPIQPTTTNHRFTTPQKLWEAIAAGVPVVASDLPGMAEVVRPAAVGELCDATSPTSIAVAIRRVLDRSQGERAALRSHVLAEAHARYNWESQLDTLFGLYAELGHPPTRHAEPEASRAAHADEPGTVAQGPCLRFSLSHPSPDRADAAERIPVVLDTTWTPTRDEATTGAVLLRDVVEGLMRERDLIAEAAAALDGWAEASGIASIMVHEGVSFWYGVRLRYWAWLLDEMLWLAVIERLVAQHPTARVLSFDDGADDQLLTAARAIAERDGLIVEVSGTLGGGNVGVAPVVSGPSEDAPGVSARRWPSRPRWVLRGRSLMGRVRARLMPSEAERRDGRILARLAQLERDPARRLLVVSAHAPQRIETPTGHRLVNVYLAPVADQLRRSRLDPFEVSIRPTTGDSAPGKESKAAEDGRTLPADVLRLAAPAVRRGAGRQLAADVAARVAAITTPLPVSGVDLGPALAARISQRIAATHGRRIDDVARIRGLLRRVHPAGILIADEYHRQDWLAAAAVEGVPVAAIQHGVIYRWHTGYMHRTRPPELRLPGRTYVFGTWERDLLTETSVYAPDEVVVGGSPRLDLVSREAVDREAVRSGLGVADGDRLVVLSGTWGTLYRRFHYPIALAHLFAGPVERVHLVVKLHPSERDEGPYRRIVEGLARAGAFAPPPITVVRDVDLYRLLAAADAHLGIHSTVLTEAVTSGTPNLLAVGLRSADLLGYVDAGVAIPVATPADLMAALEVPRAVAMDPGRCREFLDAHFEPGSASDRIADDLLRWLS